LVIPNALFFQVEIIAARTVFGKFRYYTRNGKEKLTRPANRLFT
jgi:hypothetical protein